MTLLDTIHTIQHHPFLHPTTRRLHVLLLLMFGYFTMALMTTNIGITLSCMVNSTAVAMESLDSSNERNIPEVQDIHNLNGSTTCNSVGGKVVVDYGGSFDWSVKIQGYIVGATFLGGMLATAPAGWAIDHFSNRHLLLISVLLASFASIALPFMAYMLGPISVIFLRFLMGVAEGLMIPGLNGMVTKWVPLHEKSLGASLYTSGNQLAGIVGNPVAAGLCESTLRWPAMFYLSGSLGLGWAILWMITVKNTPAKSKWISDREAAYLEHHLPKKAKPTTKRVIPWKEMFTSPALLSLTYAFIVTNMTLALILVYIPVYFKDVLFMDVKENGFYSALPHLANLLSKLVWGYFMDYLKQKKIITPTQAVKLSQGIATVLITICFLGLAFLVDCSTPTLAITFLCCLCGAFGLCISGFLTSLLSIAPNFIGIVSSITQVIGFAGRVATPQLITFFKTTGTAEEWRGILLVYATLSIICTFVFTAWGSGEVQSWNQIADLPHETNASDKSLIEKSELEIKLDQD